MALVGLYGALAASASVFIGILTALLASDLSSLKSERTRIRRRVDAIQSRLRGLQDRRESLEETLDNIHELWAEDEAAQQVDEFIDEIEENLTLQPEEVLPGRIQEEFADFLGTDRSELSEHQHRALHNRFDDIEDAATPDQGHGLFGPIPNITNPEYVAMNRQIETQWNVHTRERYDQYEREWIQTVTEMRSLRREREGLEGQYDALDPSQTISDIRAAGVTIIASVMVPILAYLLREIGFEIPYGTPAWEGGIVTLIWAGGLAWVLIHLQTKINQNEEGLPDLPDSIQD